MNRVYKLIKSKIDFNNYYTIKKALSWLEIEYKKSVKIKNKQEAFMIIEALKMIFNDFNDTYRFGGNGNEQSYIQKIWFKKIQEFIYYLEYRIDRDF